MSAVCMDIISSRRRNNTYYGPFRDFFRAELSCFPMWHSWHICSWKMNGKKKAFVNKCFKWYRVFRNEDSLSLIWKSGIWYKNYTFECSVFCHGNCYVIEWFRLKCMVWFYIIYFRCCFFYYHPQAAINKLQKGLHILSFYMFAELCIENTLLGKDVHSH